jgi:hypothetical protein
MGSSAKKKKDKKKDFQVCLRIIDALGKSLLLFEASLTFVQKPKLRVGKTKPKADNFTDTSFASKCTVPLQNSGLSMCCFYPNIIAPDYIRSLQLRWQALYYYNSMG